VSVPVVDLARLGLREDLVRLGDLAEAVVRVGGVGDIGMELAREPPERLLDVALGRVPSKAEDLVVVPLRRRHRGKGSFASAGRRRRQRAAQFSA
jgi:hypothetical protein